MQLVHRARPTNPVMTTMTARPLGRAAMTLVTIRHGDTEWTLSGRYTGITDLPLTPHGRRQATTLAPLVERMLSGDSARAFSSPRVRAAATAALALPSRPVTVDPLVAEYDYGDYEGLTDTQIRRPAPGWDIWRDGCPHGDSTEVVVTHGHFSRILAAGALGLAPENGRLFAMVTASISVIEDYHGERCTGRWNVDAALLNDSADQTASGDNIAPTETQ